MPRLTEPTRATKAYLAKQKVLHANLERAVTLDLRKLKSEPVKEKAA